MPHHNPHGIVASALPWVLACLAIGLGGCGPCKGSAKKAADAWDDVVNRLRQLEAEADGRVLETSRAAVETCNRGDCLGPKVANLQAEQARLEARVAELHAYLGEAGNVAEHLRAVRMDQALEAQAIFVENVKLDLEVRQAVDPAVSATKLARDVCE